MNFILKIVEGPNKGAEIALVSGVAVTLGKGDDCDIVLADTTLPSAPVTIEASDDGVAVDGEPLDQFVVMTTGATSFAVGPADAPWTRPYRHAAYIDQLFQTHPPASPSAAPSSRRFSPPARSAS